MLLPHLLTKQQRPSLGFIVDVALLLWVATKIVTSCPHLPVWGSGVWEGCFTKQNNPSLILMIVRDYILHQNYTHGPNPVILFVHKEKECSRTKEVNERVGHRDVYTVLHSLYDCLELFNQTNQLQDN